MLHQAAQQQHNWRNLQRSHTRCNTQLRACSTTDEAAVLRTFLQTAPSPPRPICLARVVEVSPGCKGLVAAQQLQPSQAALMLPPHNTLSVPVTDPEAAGGATAASSAYQWEGSWLQAFERAHGPLPPVLVEYLMQQQGDASLGSGTVDVEGTYQLTALLLYVQQRAAAATVADQRSFWADWLRLLPRPDQQGTAPFWTWSDAELAGLRFEPYKAAMTDSNAAAQGICQDLLHHYHNQLPGLHLVHTADDVSAALYLVKTRSIAVGSCLSLLPVHDFINHAESPNCLVSHQHMQGWHAVVPLTAIPPGTELTINYNKHPCSNLDTLLAWGFTGRPSALDPALPLAYRALPAVPVQLVAAAAADVLMDRGQQAHRIQLQEAGKETGVKIAAAGVSMGRGQEDHPLKRQEAGVAAEEADALVGQGQQADPLQLQEDCWSQLLAAAASLPLSGWGAAGGVGSGAGVGTRDVPNGVRAGNSSDSGTGSGTVGIRDVPASLNRQGDSSDSGSLQVLVDGGHSEAAGVFSREVLCSLLPRLPRARELGGQGEYVQQQQQKQAQKAAGLNTSEAAPAAAAASTYDMYISSNSKQQRARLTALESILEVAVQSVQAGSDATATAAGDADIAGAVAGSSVRHKAQQQQQPQQEQLLQQQLQLLSVRVCRAAAELQLLCACLTTQELQAVQQELGPGLQLQHKAACVTVSIVGANSASASSFGASNVSASSARASSLSAAGLGGEGTQPDGPGNSKSAVSRQQVISEHLVPALQLQQMLAAELIVLQASLVASAFEVPAHSANTAAGGARDAADAVLQSVTARRWPHLLCLGSPGTEQQQQELLNLLHTLQQRQQQHLTACKKLLPVDGERGDMSCCAERVLGAGAEVGTGGSSRVAVAAATNSIQQGLLQQCVALLRRAEGSIAQEQMAQGQ